MVPRRSIALFFCVWANSAVATADEPAAKPVSFVRDVRPILARHCYACHGPDEAQLKAKLRLDSREDAFREHDSGTPFVAGSLEKSEVVQRIISTDPVDRMPSGKDAAPLLPEQIALIKRWVEEGANWESHWAFEVPVKPALPAEDAADSSLRPIDRFIHARLKAEGLQPSPEADPATLLRRVALDLTGLPPTPEMAAAYLKNPSPEGYEKLVDHLLAEPAYGERWARVWLDLARYADTKGYEKDLKRSIYRFRDWVIDSLNADKPYDKFSIEQLAGDLLPNPTPDQLLATAFHRNTLTNDEGGTDNEEFRVAAVKDRVDTTGQVWLGLTLGCAKCHSHKYDPISQREYYQLFGFFNQTADNDQGDDAPLESFPTAEQKQRLTAIAAEIAAKEASLETESPEKLKGLSDWEEAIKHSKWRLLEPKSAKAESGSVLKMLDDRSILAVGEGPSVETYRVVYKLEPGKATGLRLETLTDPSLPKGGVGRSKGDGNFVLTGIEAALVLKDGSRKPLRFNKAEADFAQDQYPIEHALKNPGPTKHGWAVSPKLNESHRAVFHCEQPIDIVEGAELEVVLDHRFQFVYPGFSLGRFRVALTDQASPSIDGEPPAEIAAILNVVADKRSPEQTKRLLRYFNETITEGKATLEAVAKLRAESDTVLKEARTPIYRELPPEKRRVTKIHRRGNFLDQGDVVEANVPASFAPLAADAPRDRLGFARWLFEPKNPLTARVAVNRQWSIFFGKGLVETQEDFGSQGQPPSHPELLDWLAVSFRENGWSLKWLCREIVLSSTYKQTSKVTPELAQKDRTNRWLARGPRFRLEAEMIRDNALAVSGLLSRKLHGPSVMPFQPEGIWRSTYNADKWVTKPGEESHRRGLYTFIKRTSPYPAMIAFDAPSRELCTVRRIASNTPLQALVTLNDAVYIEAAQALARRMRSEGGDTLDKQIAFGLKTALIREPADREVESLAKLYKRRFDAYKANKAEAIAFATVPLGPLPEKANAEDLAALTSVANVILNLDEFLTKH